ncbi:FAD-binding oxidoreductase [Terrarubrum flagellatum]|uniref:FAD-binding oxidoreductase n=1 Tax=Terrirubrum flagellatum TaxID=2895980 RepID=UPI0031456F5D
MATSMPARATGATGRYDIEGFIKDIGDTPVITDPMTIRRRSRDFFWYSPILNAELHGKTADIVAAPRDEADIIRIAASCARRRIPLCVRAGGTGNYGQMVPLEGGVLLDINALNRIEWHKPGIVRAQAGARMHEMDAELRPAGWELRMHPSTKRMATIGGFVSGGSGGIGSVTYGGLREPGNIIAARVVTLEDEPRVLELRRDEVLKINRTYGTTGIVTAVEMPLAPAWPWIDVVVAFDDFSEAMRIGQAIANADGIIKKLITPMAWPIPQHFGPMTAYCPEGKAVIFAMIAEPSMESFRMVVRNAGEVTYEKPNDESPEETPLYEYTWNHTTLQWLKQDRTITYLQCLYPADRLLESVKEMQEMFPDEVLPHTEFMRFNGRITCSALPIVRYTTAERLNEIIALHEKHGVFIANPHVYTLEDGTRHKKTDADQLGFKAEVDPYGLLNPGKMRTYVPVRQ